MLSSALALMCSVGAAQAQVETNLSASGGLRMGYSTTSCDAAAAGGLRFNSASGGSIDFCNGTLWQNVINGAPLDSLIDAETDYTTDFNMFMGSLAGGSVLTGSQYNLLIGIAAGNGLTTGSNNLAIGYAALADTLSTDNIAIGTQALAGQNYVTGTYEHIGTVAIGYRAGFGTGNNSVAIGSLAAGATTGSGGNDNVVIGKEAMLNRRGNENVAVGINSMSGTGINSHGNVALGAYTLNGSNAGSVITQNVAIGYEAGKVMVTGSDNVLVGYQAGSNITNGVGNIIIGSGLSAPAATTNNYLSMGDMIYGALDTKRVGINDSTPSYTLEITGDGAYTGVAYDISDRRRKADIKSLAEESAHLMALAPVSFVMKDDSQRQLEYGFIAQDVAKIYPDVVKTAADTDQSLSLNYVGLIAPMVKSIQERQVQLEDNQQKIDALRARLTKQ